MRVHQTASFVFHREHVLDDGEKEGTSRREERKNGKRRGTKSGKLEQEFPLFHSFPAYFLHVFNLLSEKNISTLQTELKSRGESQEAMWHSREPERARSGPEETGRKVRYCNKIQTRECKQVI